MPKTHTTKRVSKLRKNLARAPGLVFVRSRLQVAWTMQHHLLERRSRFAGLTSFRALIDSIDEVLKFTLKCELMLLDSAWEHIQPEELQLFIGDVMGASLWEDVQGWSPHIALTGDSVAHDDVEALMEREWGGIVTLLEQFEDAMGSTAEVVDFALPAWRQVMNNVMLRLDTEEPEADSATTVRVFSGDLFEADESFSCKVDRLVLRETTASLQMSCNDDGGPHTAEGAFVLARGAWRTESFVVRYAGVSEAVQAEFNLQSAKFTAEGQYLEVRAEWSQAGDTYLLEGELETSDGGP